MHFIIADDVSGPCDSYDGCSCESWNGLLRLGPVSTTKSSLDRSLPTQAALARSLNRKSVVSAVTLTLSSPTHQNGSRNSCQGLRYPCRCWQHCWQQLVTHSHLLPGESMHIHTRQQPQTATPAAAVHPGGQCCTQRTAAVQQAFVGCAAAHERQYHAERNSG